VVDGRFVLRDGRLPRLDEPAILAAVRELHARIAPELDRSDLLVDELRPHYERIHRRGLATAIPDDTYPARR